MAFLLQKQDRNSSVWVVVGIRPLDCNNDENIVVHVSNYWEGYRSKMRMRENNQYHALRLSYITTLLISFVCYFKICNSLFSICQLYTCFSFLLFTLIRPCKTGIFSISQLAYRLNARKGTLFHNKIHFCHYTVLVNDQLGKKFWRGNSVPSLKSHDIFFH